MSTASIEELADRVTVLESQLNELRLRYLISPSVPAKKDWRKTIGMFSGDEIMQRIDQEAAAMRDRERAEAESDADEDAA